MHLGILICYFNLFHCELYSPNNFEDVLEIPKEIYYTISCNSFIFLLISANYNSSLYICAICNHKNIRY